MSGISVLSPIKVSYNSLVKNCLVFFAGRVFSFLFFRNFIFHQPYFHISILFSFYFYLLLFSYSCPTFPPLLTPTMSPRVPQSIPLSSVPMNPLFMFLCLPLPLLSHYPPLPSSLVTINLLFISKSLVLFCLFVCFVG